MSNKKRKPYTKHDIFSILDGIDLLQNSKNDEKVLYVPKKMYKIAKKLLKIEGKTLNAKIKTY